MQRTSLLGWIALLVLLVGSFAWRCRAVVELDGRLWIDDPDTVHRLARMEAIDSGLGYPVVDPREGAPQGVESHWTLPMDWFIRLLTPLGRLIWPTARGYEAGAVLAGPVLALLATLLVVWFARRLFSPLAGLAAGAIYSASWSTLNVSWIGNGDHQTLQGLAILAALGNFLLVISGLAGVPTAVASGACLGFAVWVSAESMLVVYLFALAAFVLAWREREGGADLRRCLQAVCTGLLAVLVVGTLLEQRKEPWRLLWDSVSLFHVWQVAILTAFCLLLAWPLRGGKRAMVAALCGIALGTLPLLWPAMASAVAATFEQARGTELWGKHEVSEYRSAFWDGVGYSFWKPIERFSVLVLGVPVLALVLWRSTLLPNPGVAALLLFCFGTLGLGLYQVKLAHWSVAPVAWVLVGATTAYARTPRRLGDVLGKSLPWIFVPLAAAALAVASPSPPGREKEPSAREAAEGRRRVLAELCAKIGELSKQLPGSSAGASRNVLAPWSLGAHLHYVAKASIVASGYHRNLAGITDAHRVFLADAALPSGYQPILTARQVDLVVVWPDRYFFATAPKVLADPREYVKLGRGTLQLLPAAERSLYWALRRGAKRPPPGFHLAATSKAQIDMGYGAEAAFLIYRVER